MDSGSFAFDHWANVGSVFDHLTGLGHHRLAGVGSVMEEHVGRITGPGLVSSAEQFDRRLAGPVGDVRSVLDERFTVGGLTSSGLVSSAEQFDRLAGSRSVIEAITPRLDSLADFRSVLDERFAVDRLAVPGSLMEELDERFRVYRLADVRSVFDHLTGLDHYRLAGLGPLVEEQVGRITGVDRRAGQRSDASALRPAIEPADVPAATLLLLLLAFAVTRAGLADTVLENVLAFGRLGVGGLEWLSEQLPDPTAVFWAQFLKAMLLAGKDGSAKE